VFEVPTGFAPALPGLQPGAYLLGYRTKAFRAADLIVPPEYRKDGLTTSFAPCRFQHFSSRGWNRTNSQIGNSYPAHQWPSLE
jgi:hypothetical protein